MDVLVIVPPGAYAHDLGTTLVDARSDLVDAADHEVRDALVERLPTVVIHSRPLSDDVLAAWSSACQPKPAISVYIDARLAESATLSDPDGWSSYAGTNAGVHSLVVAGRDHPVSRALSVAERLFQRLRLGMPPTEAIAEQPALPSPTPNGKRPRQVLLVGLGIVNLVTARFLSRAGFAVTVLEGGPDPRADRSWTQYGCSRGGGNARMFTLTEADDYHDKALASPPVNDLFRRPISERGWLLCHPRPSEDSWIRDFERVPGWLAYAFNGDIFSFNKRSAALWEEWLQSDPALFQGAGLRHDILRLYSDPTYLSHAIRRHASIGAIREVYTSQEVRREFPALRDAAGAALTGAIGVQGFTVQIHDFMALLLDQIAGDGVDLQFETPVTGLDRDRRGRVAGVVTSTGEFWHADDYVFSPGTTGWDLARGSELEHKVHGILGGWVRLPNMVPRLHNSLKLTYTGHYAEDANVTVAETPTGESELIVGSGYGYVGLDARRLRTEQLEVLLDAIVDTVKAYFPRALEAAGECAVRSTFQYCVRPWTASNLGIFHGEDAVAGVAVWTGGHNTGGFAQAPAVAEAVISSLRGQPHPMHWAYSPGRLDAVLSAPPRRSMFRAINS